jgi:hypothetical protein
MSKRLQVLLPDEEMKEIQRLARQEHSTVGEWVRRTLKDAGSRKPVTDAESKLLAVRRAVEFNAPTADIDEMLREIERGYLD